MPESEDPIELSGGRHVLEAILLAFLACPFLLSAQQKPTLKDVMEGQEKGQKQNASDQAATVKAVDAATEAVQAANARASQEAANAAVQRYKADRDRKDQLAALSRGLKALQDAKDVADQNDRDERKRVADAAAEAVKESTEAHADTMSKLKTFGFSALGLLLSALITLVAKSWTDRKHQQVASNKLEKITQLVDGEKTAAMKTTVCVLRDQLALLNHLSPEAKDAIAMTESQIRDRELELADRARYMAKADCCAPD